MLIPFQHIANYNITPTGVIHVGMHIGEEYPVYLQNGVQDILFIEANKDLCDKYGPMMPKAAVINAAIANYEGIAKFYVTNNGESSSLLPLGEHAYIYPHITVSEVRTVAVTTLDTILKTTDPGLFNILNLDIQGAELMALDGFSHWYAIEAIFCEINWRELYVGCPHVDQVSSFLRTKGFKLAEIVDSGAGWGDGLFVRL
jgi:FkbM family methyltransferase